MATVPRLVSWAVFAAAFIASGVGRADPVWSLPDPPRRHPHWDPAWTHSNAWDYSLAGVSAATAIAEGVFLQPMRPPLRWSGPILFDADVRSALRASNQHTQNTLETVSWGLWAIQVAYPLFVDVPFAWARGHGDLARDLFWQDAATLTFAAAVDLGVRDIAGRARPIAYDCLSHGETNCLGSVDSTRSFPGGHIVNSTAASVLTCTQHFYTELYGGPWDATACATTLTSNLAIAVMRIVSDNHWASDQLAGMAIGGVIGWGVPFVMHLHGRASSGASGASDSKKHAPSETSAPGVMAIALPMALDHGAGLSLSGIF